METSGVYFGSLKRFLLSVKLENIRIGTSQHIGYSELENTGRIDIFVHVRLHSLCILQGGAEDFRGGSQIFRAKKGGI